VNAVALPPTAHRADPQIDRLERELAHLRDKRGGIETAIGLREQKLNRLKTRRVQDAAPASALPTAPACFV
jgi:hypothetical protein